MNDEWLESEKGNGCYSCYLLVRTVPNTGHLRWFIGTMIVGSNWLPGIWHFDLPTNSVVYKFTKPFFTLVYHVQVIPSRKWSHPIFFGGAGVVCSVHPWEYLAGPYKPKDGGWGGNPFCWLPGSKDACHLVGEWRREMCAACMQAVCVYCIFLYSYDSYVDLYVYI